MSGANIAEMLEGRGQLPVGESRVLRGYISEDRPPPVGFPVAGAITGLVWVTVPDQTLDYVLGPCQWSADHGTALPKQGAQCVVVIDQSEVPTVVWWEGAQGEEFFVLGPPPPRPTITGTTIYVSAAGSDANTGRSEASPYATVAKALTQTLEPGDGVLLRGGDTFAEGLSVSVSGIEGSPIVFGSYGNGNPILAGQIFPSPGPDWLTFDHLTVKATGSSVSSLAGFGNHIRIQNCNMTSELATAITVSSGLRKRTGPIVEDYLTPPVGWEILHNVIHDTGDSGILIGAAIEQAQHGSEEESTGRRTAEFPGEGMVIEGNIICRTGTNAALTYGKHGIYLKAKNSTVRRNLITEFSADGVSQRYSNCIVEENQISSGPIALAFFQYGNASTLGESTWARNTINNVNAAAFYAPSTETSWTGGVATAIPTAEAFILSGNVVSGATEGNNINSTKVYDDGSNAYFGVAQGAAIPSPAETTAALKKATDELRLAIKRAGITA